MAVYVSNLTVNAGTTFSQVFNLESTSSNAATDITGYSIAAQMRKHAGAKEPTAHFTSTIDNASQGKIRVGLSTSDTAGLKEGRYVYDVLITDPTGEVTRVVEGSVLVRAGVTR
jgi:hypothetical protein|tara:strand:- start:227 stop:568 length:342 start_codon:yes stop_codon:yes gene_type:complete